MTGTAAPTPAPALLTTGFVVDAAGEGTIYPSAGGNSADRRVQAVYWRCLLVLFTSARITNPELRLALYTNVAPPVVDGVHIAARLADLGVELRLRPLTRRMPAGRVASWGNVLYFFDITDDLAGEDPALRFAIVDSDILVARSIAPLFAMLDAAEFVAYDVDTRPDVTVNGLSRNEMTEVAREVLGYAGEQPVLHLGGEFLAATVGAWQQRGAAFARLFALGEAGAGVAGRISTEEHIYSIALAANPGPVALANGMLRRIWTSPRHNTARNGDTDHALWHLPAEKRYGFADLFADIAAGRIDAATSPEDLRRRAGLRMGLPAKTLNKILHDGVRQIAAKLGRRR